MAPAVAKHFKYLVLGGGSGGIASARRAAELLPGELSVGLIEKGNLGGTCVRPFNFTVSRKSEYDCT